MRQACGRELDALVAQRVMGFVEVIPADAESHRLGRDFLARHSIGSAFSSLPRYSTDIAYAWLVVEEFERRGWRVTMEHDPLRHGWDCMLRAGLDQFFFGHGAAAPHAICLAAIECAGGSANEHEASLGV